MAQWVMKQMKGLGWQVLMDNSGEKNKSNCGNVYTYWKVNPNFRTLVFCAHMDTVQARNQKIRVTFDGGIFKSDGRTILGADNKAGVISLILVAHFLEKKRLHSNLLFFFPTREEAGLIGSSFFDFPKVKFVYNIDSSDKPGVFIYKSLGYQNFKIKVHGIASHAAKAYEKGKNAILIAVDLLKSLPIGRNTKEGWTLNIGIIKGGKDTNVVCDFVELKGELRAFNLKKMEFVMNLLKNSCLRFSKKYQTLIEVFFDKKEFISPFSGKKEGEINKICIKACKKLGLRCLFKKSYSTSDANSFSGKGLEVISVSRGGKNAHSNEEEVSLSDLKRTIKLVNELMYLS